MTHFNSNELFAQAAEQYKTAVAPVVKVNQLTVAGLEKVTAFQMAALRTYLDISLARMKAATQVDSPESLQSFIKGQVETAEVLRTKLAEDSKALTQISTEFKSQLDALAKESAEELGRSIKQAFPQAA